jgi:hypothetical protein
MHLEAELSFFLVITVFNFISLLLKLELLEMFHRVLFQIKQCWNGSGLKQLSVLISKYMYAYRYTMTYTLSYDSAASISRKFPAIGAVPS